VAAAKAGKHIFYEKPISLSLKEIDRFLAVEASAGVKLQVGFNRRFDANFLRVRQAVRKQEIPRPAGNRAHRFAPVRRKLGTEDLGEDRVMHQRHDVG
jgi:predicted dehydrogenase